MYGARFDKLERVCPARPASHKPPSSLHRLQTARTLQCLAYRADFLKAQACIGIACTALVLLSLEQCHNRQFVLEEYLYLRNLSRFTRQCHECAQPPPRK